MKTEILKVTNDIVDMFSQPKFLTGVSIVTSVGAIGAAIWGTNAAIKKKQTTGATGIKLVAQLVPYYIPCLGLEAISIYTNINGVRIAENKAVEFAVLYAITNRQLIMEREANKKAAEEFFGPKKLEQFKARKTEEIARMTGQVSRKDIQDTGRGDQLFYDVFTDQYFLSSYEAVSTALANLDRQLINEMWVDIDDWCDELGIKRLPSRVGHHLGFDAEVFNKMPVGAPNADWAYVGNVRQTCGYIQFENEPRNIYDRSHGYTVY